MSITKMANHLNQFDLNNQIDIKVLREIILKIYQMNFKYYKDTGRFYPHFQVQNLLLDQKTLSFAYSQPSILLDAIGFRNSMKNTELSLVTLSTPTRMYPNSEGSHLENSEKNRILLNRKYFTPQTYFLNAEEEQARRNQIQEFELLQQIHVYRFINTMHTILKGISLAEYFYDEFNAHYIKPPNKTPPYSLKYYEETQKQIYEKLVSNQLPLEKLIPMSDQEKNNQIDQQVSKQKQLQFSKVTKYFSRFEFDDSLLDSLKFESIRLYLYERYLLLQNFKWFFLKNHHLAFQYLENRKKYILFYILVAFEEAISAKFINDKKIERKKFEKSTKLSSDLDDYRKQRQKYRQYIMLKLKSYESQNKLDNCDLEVFSKIKIINHQKLSEIIGFQNIFKKLRNEELQLASSEEKYNLLDDFIQQIRKFDDEILKDKVICKKDLSFQEKIVHLEQYLRISVTKRYNAIFEVANEQLRLILEEYPKKKLHKNCLGKQLGKYYTLRFKVMIETFLYLNELNWKIYQSMLKSLLRIIPEEKQKIQEDKMTQTQIKKEIKKMKIIRQRMQQ